jgi:hypothetical protein
MYNSMHCSLKIIVHFIILILKNIWYRKQFSKFGYTQKIWNLLIFIAIFWQNLSQFEVVGGSMRTYFVAMKMKDSTHSCDTLFMCTYLYAYTWPLWLVHNPTCVREANTPTCLKDLQVVYTQTHTYGRPTHLLA